MTKLPKGVEIVGPMKPGYEKILTPDALDRWIEAVCLYRQ